MKTILYICFTFSHCRIFNFSNFILLVHAMYICFVLNDELYIYISIACVFYILFQDISALRPMIIKTDRLKTPYFHEISYKDHSLFRPLWADLIVGLYIANFIDHSLFRPLWTDPIVGLYSANFIDHSLFRPLWVDPIVGLYSAS